ncbi:hypothetical protein [Fodinicola feengrottensis]|uniref:Uncharacterized protein n=1 Tax=Fodinicola feengrottensis TaxID=435914 RepID=A0ABP4RMP4_9ACTN|nr:hypothetical protein [Fodinicola feengrottensis]
MSKEKQEHGLIDFTDQLAGGVLSWIAGKDTIRSGRSAVDSTLGELVSWTGLVRAGDRRAR